MFLSFFRAAFIPFISKLLAHFYTFKALVNLLFAVAFFEIGFHEPVKTYFRFLNALCPHFR